MGAGNILPKGIAVTLNGEEKILRFTMKSMAILAEKYGTITDVLEIFQVMSTGVLSARELHAIADLFSAALLCYDKKATAEWVEDNFDFDELKDALPKVIEAFMSSMGVNNNSQGDKADPQTA